MRTKTSCKYGESVCGLRIDRSAKNTRTNRIPNSVLSDLCSRFIINLPPDELLDGYRVAFQIEIAHWFYIDYCCMQNRELTPVKLREFFIALCNYVPFLRQPDDVINNMYDQWVNYKRMVPTYGAVILNHSMDKIVLVQSFTSSSWGFPKGKINQYERPLQCAVREVYEEIGIDISSEINPDQYSEATVNNQFTRLYFIVLNEKMKEPNFTPQTKGEIKSINWFPVHMLPLNKEAAAITCKMYNGLTFFMVVPFMREISEWIQRQKTSILSETRFSLPQPLNTEKNISKPTKTRVFYNQKYKPQNHRRYSTCDTFSSTNQDINHILECGFTNTNINQIAERNSALCMAGLNPYGTTMTQGNSIASPRDYITRFNCDSSSSKPKKNALASFQSTSSQSSNLQFDQSHLQLPSDSPSQNLRSNKLYKPKPMYPNKKYSDSASSVPQFSNSSTLLPNDITKSDQTGNVLQSADSKSGTDLSPRYRILKRGEVLPSSVQYTGSAAFKVLEQERKKSEIGVEKVSTSVLASDKYDGTLLNSRRVEIGQTNLMAKTGDADVANAVKCSNNGGVTTFIKNYYDCESNDKNNNSRDSGNVDSHNINKGYLSVHPSEEIIDVNYVMLDEKDISQYKSIVNKNSFIPIMDELSKRVIKASSHSPIQKQSKSESSIKLGSTTLLPKVLGTDYDKVDNGLRNSRSIQIGEANLMARNGDNNFDNANKYSNIKGFTTLFKNNSDYGANVKNTKTASNGKYLLDHSSEKITPVNYKVPDVKDISRHDSIVNQNSFVPVTGELSKQFIKTSNNLLVQGQNKTQIDHGLGSATLLPKFLNTVHNEHDGTLFHSGCVQRGEAPIMTKQWDTDVAVADKYSNTESFTMKIKNDYSFGVNDKNNNSGSNGNVADHVISNRCLSDSNHLMVKSQIGTESHLIKHDKLDGTLLHNRSAQIWQANNGKNDLANIEEGFTPLFKNNYKRRANDKNNNTGGNRNVGDSNSEYVSNHSLEETSDVNCKMPDEKDSFQYGSIMNHNSFKPIMGELSEQFIDTSNRSPAYQLFNNDVNYKYLDILSSRWYNPSQQDDAMKHTSISKSPAYTSNENRTTAALFDFKNASSGPSCISQSNPFDVNIISTELSDMSLESIPNNNKYCLPIDFSPELHCGNTVYLTVPTADNYSHSLSVDEIFGKPGNMFGAKIEETDGKFTSPGTNKSINATNKSINARYVNDIESNLLQQLKIKKSLEDSSSNLDLNIQRSCAEMKQLEHSIKNQERTKYEYIDNIRLKSITNFEMDKEWTKKIFKPNS